MLYADGCLALRVYDRAVSHYIQYLSLYTGTSALLPTERLKAHQVTVAHGTTGYHHLLSL